MAERLVRSLHISTLNLRWQRQAQSKIYDASNDEYPMLTTRYDNDNTTIHEPNDMLRQDSREAERMTWFRRYRKRTSGWRVAALHFGIWAAIVCLINLIVTVSVFSTRRTAQDILSEGDCGRIKRLNSVFHAIINILSTVLLSGSNYCMQCLSAPTRAEVDAAHAKNRRLDIGVPSFRNLTSIGRKRLVLWCLLGLSSIPLHLLYNSAIYASLSSNNYRVFMVGEAFLEDTQCRDCSDTPNTVEYVLGDLWSKSRINALDRLEPAQCLEQYATEIQTERRNLLLVASDDRLNQSDRYTRYTASNSTGYFTGNITNTNVYRTFLFEAADAKRYGSAVSAYGWICSGTPLTKGMYCSAKVDTIKDTPATWRVAAETRSAGTFPVDYCLSEKAVPRCKLHFNLSIAIVVIILNFYKFVEVATFNAVSLTSYVPKLTQNFIVKAALMFYTVFSIAQEPLMTIGDAVASFLESEDPSTRKRCLLAVKDTKLSSEPIPMVWEDPQFRWRDTTSRARSIVNLSWLVIALIVVSGLLAVAVKQSGLDAATVMRLGFGAVDARTIISSENGEFPTDTVAVTLIANLPQVVLSLIYFSYNAAFTAMLMGREWIAYARSPRGLRVSRKPVRRQRSTYFLQLPYRFGIPLVLLSGALHWLVSQSIFLVAIDVYDEYGRPGSENYNSMTYGWETCGFSPIAMLVVLIIGLVMLVAIVGSGYVPYSRGMPLAGSSSIAISAACHPVEEFGPEDNALSESKLQWGVVSTNADGIGHCAFSSKKVDKLVKGEKYA